MIRAVLAAIALACLVAAGATAQVGQIPAWPPVQNGIVGGGGAHTLIAHKSVAGITGGTTAAVSSTGATLIVLTLNCFTNSGANPCTPSDSATNTWTEDSNSGTWAQSSYQTRIYHKYAPTTSGTHTFTLACAGGGNCFANMEVLVFNGTFVGALDQVNHTATSGSPGSITPTANTELIITETIYDSTTNSLSVGSGFTISDQVAPVGGANTGGGAAYLDQAIAAAVNPTWTVTGVTPNVTGIASFK